jgi:(2Fe-2S) ferredoxin
MSYYKHHVFFCLNKRDPPAACCASHNAEVMKDHAKKRVKGLKLKGEGGVRINSAGCLDRCEHGPCIVVYPEGTWYTYVDKQDIDEIVDEHLVAGRVVERLLI